MTKKRLESSARARRIVKNVRRTRDSKIDFSDIPPSTDEELKRAKRVQRVAKSFRYVPDSELDRSDIPGITDGEVKRARRVGRPATGNAKTLIAIRVAPQVLAGVRRAAAKQRKPYQTFIHELLEKAASKHVA